MENTETGDKLTSEMHRVDVGSEVFEYGRYNKIRRLEQGRRGRDADSQREREREKSQDCVSQLRNNLCIVLHSLGCIIGLCRNSKSYYVTNVKPFNAIE
jgi:hypothetical protein